MQKSNPIAYHLPPKLDDLLNNIKHITPYFDGCGLRVGVVAARFNDAISHTLSIACLETLQSLGVATDNISFLSVPGALEVPNLLRLMTKSRCYDVLIALGVIIRGETYHFEVVANQSSEGIMRLNLDFDTPIINGILTTENEAQALERVQVKGQECARVALEMAHYHLALPAILPTVSHHE